MDFSWTQTQEAEYSNILQLTQEKLNYASKKRKNSDQFEARELLLCGELGLLGLSVPKKYGGRGFDTLTTARMVEAFGRGCNDMGLVFSACAHLFACVMPIVEYASEEIKEAILPKLCSGEKIGATAITEKEAGSDVFALKTKATCQDDIYILTGGKSYVTNGPIADVTLIYAITNPNHGYLGMSAFMVEKNTPGFEVGKPFVKMGLTSTPASEIYLIDCNVPSKNKLGSEGQGALIFKRSMQWERLCLFASYLGMMECQLEKTIAYAQKRHQSSKSIGKNQAISHRIADMKIRLETSRLLLYCTCWLFDQGKQSAIDVSMSKLVISEAAIQSSLDAIQIHGAVGYTAEAGIEQTLRDSIPSTIFSGTSEIQRNLIAGELGL